MSKIHGTNVHILPDENLGGVLREYIEVDRVANVGDKIVIVNPSTFQFGDDYTQGTIMTVEKADTDGDVYCGKFDLIDKDEYQTIEPTSIVHIDGVRYRMVGRNAKVGEKVIVVEANDMLVYENIGEVVEIIETDGDTCGGMLKPFDFGEKGAIYHFQYLVLEPIDDESPKTTEDLIANLAQRVAELERKLGEYARKVDGMEADIQNINVDLGTVEENVNKALADITTQPLTVEGDDVQIRRFSITSHADGETNVDISYYGNISAENITQAITKALRGGIDE